MDLRRPLASALLSDPLRSASLTECLAASVRCVGKGDGKGAGDGGSVEAFADLGTASHDHLGKGMTEPICLSHLGCPSGSKLLR